MFERFFDYVVQLCQQAGLVWGQELPFDVTKVRANANVDSLRPRWYIAAKAHLHMLFTDEANSPASEAIAGQDEGPEGASAVPATVQVSETDPEVPVRLPFRGTDAEEQALDDNIQADWRLPEAHRLDPDRPARRGYQRTTDSMVSSTDPDATPMRTRGSGAAKLGYHDHYVVDGGRARIILAAFVTPADVMDNQAMLDLLHRVRFRWQLRPRRAVADAKYGTIENIAGLEAEGIQAYTPLPDFDGRTEYYGASRFRYGPERDVYICPQEQELPFWRDKPTEQVRVYRASWEACWHCPVRSECTDSLGGRIIHRSFFANFIERIRATTKRRRSRRRCASGRCGSSRCLARPKTGTVYVDFAYAGCGR